MLIWCAPERFSLNEASLSWCVPWTMIHPLLWSGTLRPRDTLSYEKRSGTPRSETRRVVKASFRASNIEMKGRRLPAVPRLHSLRQRSSQHATKPVPQSTQKPVLKYLVLGSWTKPEAPNSWTYNFVDNSGHNLESSQTWGFFMDFLHHREGSMVFWFSYFLLYNVQ